MLLTFITLRRGQDGTVLFLHFLDIRLYLVYHLSYLLDLHIIYFKAKPSTEFIIEHAVFATRMRDIPVALRCVRGHLYQRVTRFEPYMRRQTVLPDRPRPVDQYPLTKSGFATDTSGILSRYDNVTLRSRQRSHQHKAFMVRLATLA